MTIKKLGLFTAFALVMCLAAIASDDWLNQIFWGLALILDGTALWRALRREAGDVE